MKLAETVNRIRIKDKEIPVGSRAFLHYHLNPDDEYPFVFWQNREFDELDSPQPADYFNVLEDLKPQRIRLVQDVAHQYKGADGKDFSYTFLPTTSAWLLSENLIYIDDDDIIIESQRPDVYEHIGVYDVSVDTGEDMSCLHGYQDGLEGNMHFKVRESAEYTAEEHIDSGIALTAAIVEWFGPCHQKTLKVYHHGNWYIPQQPSE